MFASQAEKAVRSFTVSDSAINRIAHIMEAEKSENMMLRVSVSGGGCSGFQYGFTFDDATTPDDHLFERDGITVVVDDTSLDLLDGAELDFVTDLMGASFQITNPNATSSCGCGSSFAI
ncbi:MAG TPA: iron-sulfur cluster insertion protein ErpA [Rhodospirillaceae bacterium]|nr:iron-sulfur cluster insertion protein ErpA [Rhodospirillaceae bacterium]HAA91720.1 iron-sulfur cluster insertion protein ErpA [Rhodospirillaceae bacterium]HAT34156.1 iron-sulfur cluster insertion protein ErpA [Rhodospirillaceae bacterium]